MTSSSSFEAIRKIDNRRRGLPFISFFLVAALILIAYWFFRGGSFRLYASLFFGLYHFTRLSWLSIILVSVVQNFIFLPLRIIGERYWSDIKDFEHELEKTKEEDQYFMLNKRVRAGDPSIIFYIFNFVLLTIAFVSAGRVFLLEFYHTPISRTFLYNFIPYPEYPLRGTIFRFPLVHVTHTIAVNWSTIGIIWLVVIAILVALRLLWLLVRFFLTRNPSLLQIRIGYNRLILFIGSFIGTLLVVSTFFLRHIPTAAYVSLWSADLSKQNTTFNIITAVASFFAAIYAGYSHQREAAADAKAAGIPDLIINRVFANNMKISFRNGIFLAATAYGLTHLLPCSHDLSVLSFEALYVLSPVTFDLLIPKKRKNTSVIPQAVPAAPASA